MPKSTKFGKFVSIAGTNANNDATRTFFAGSPSHSKMDRSDQGMKPAMKMNQVSISGHEPNFSDSSIISYFVKILKEFLKICKDEIDKNLVRKIVGDYMTENFKQDTKYKVKTQDIK